MKSVSRAVLAAAVLLTASLAANAAPKLLTEGLAGASGSTVGPDGYLYVTEGAHGQVTKVDPRTGDTEPFATGLPQASALGTGGAVDVEFIGDTAYVLVTMVATDLNDLFGPVVPEPGNVVGIYRIDGPDSHTIIADIGAWNMANPPDTRFDIPTGVQYAMDVYRGGLLVTDGHHNRLLWVTFDGEISDFAAFLNIVPTGLTARGKTVLMAQAGPAPHLPEDGKIVAFGPLSHNLCSGPVEIASGAPLLVDVQFGRGHRLYGLAQGTWNGAFPGSPAESETGQLVKVLKSGRVKVLVEGLDIPTSMQFIGDTAYVVTLTGQIWKIRNVSKL